MLKEFAGFIEDKTSFTVGTTLQVGFTPQDAPDRCNTIIESVGGDSNFDIPGNVNPVFQILSRSTRGKLANIFDARDDAWEIFNALTGNAGVIIKSAQWTFPIVDKAYIADTIEAVGVPAYIGQDEQGRYKYSTNYLVRLREV